MEELKRGKAVVKTLRGLEKRRLFAESQQPLHATDELFTKIELLMTCSSQLDESQASWGAGWK